LSISLTDKRRPLGRCIQIAARGVARDENVRGPRFLGYRTIATAIGQLHQERKIAQDGEGKYEVRKDEG